MKLYFVKGGEVVECNSEDIDIPPWEDKYHTTPAAAIQAEVERAFKKTESLYAEYQSAAKGETQIRFWSQQKLAELGEGK